MLYPFILCRGWLLRDRILNATAMFLGLPELRAELRGISCAMWDFALQHAAASMHRTASGYDAPNRVKQSKFVDQVL